MAWVRIAIRSGWRVSIIEAIRIWRRARTVEDTSDLAEEGADPLCARRDLDVEQLLHGEGVAELVGHHRDIVEAVKVREGLDVRLVLDELLRPAVQQANVGVRAQDLLAVELEDHAQYAVRRGVLGAEVYCVLPISNHPFFLGY
jgi:hypothetical protein